MASMQHMNTWWLVENGEFTPISHVDVHEDGSPVLERLRVWMPGAYFERMDLHGGASDWIGTLWFDEDGLSKGLPGNALATSLAVRFGGHNLVWGGNLVGRAILQCIPDFIVPA